MHLSWGAKAACMPFVMYGTNRRPLLGAEARFNMCNRLVCHGCPRKRDVAACYSIIDALLSWHAAFRCGWINPKAVLAPSLELRFIVCFRLPWPAATTVVFVRNSYLYYLYSVVLLSSSTKIGTAQSQWSCPTQWNPWLATSVYMRRAHVRRCWKPRPVACLSLIQVNMLGQPQLCTTSEQCPISPTTTDRQQYSTSTTV